LDNFSTHLLPVRAALTPLSIEIQGAEAFTTAIDHGRVKLRFPSRNTRHPTFSGFLNRHRRL